MVESVTFQSGTLATIPDGSKVAADIIASEIYQRVKITVGPDGTATDVSDANPLPVIIKPVSADALTEAVISFAASGDNTVVAAGAGSQTVKVYRLMLVVSGATNLTFKSGATGLTGAMAFTANGSMVLDLSGEPWFTTGAATAFVINSSVAVQVSGQVGSITS